MRVSFAFVVRCEQTQSHFYPVVAVQRNTKFSSLNLLLLCRDLSMVSRVMVTTFAPINHLSILAQPATPLVAQVQHAQL